MRYFVVLVVVAVSNAVAFSQSVSTYLNETSQSNGMITITGTMQTGGWTVPSALHTYTQYITIKSPSGRSADCYVSNQVPATQSYDKTCEADLSGFDGSGNFETGNYTLGGSQSAFCTVVGQFANVPVQGQIGAQKIVAYYYYTNSNSRNPDGTYSAAYKRCHPIASTCDTCSMIFGGPPFPSYGLFSGGEFHYPGVNICVMAFKESASNCNSADPVPGVGGGIWAKVDQNRTRPRRANASAVPERDFTVASLRGAFCGSSIN